MDFNIQRNQSLLSNNTRVGWMSDPPGRGTISILVSCISTLLLCVFSAIHLNIPPRNERYMGYLWRHAKWSLMGILGPELVVWVAWRQLISARSLLKHARTPGRWASSLCERIIRADGATVNKAFEPWNFRWTLKHAYYASMGGFVIDVDQDASREDKLFADVTKVQRLTLTPRGVDLLGQCGLLPAISEEEIWDKSKEDGLGKAIACLQAGWLIAQLISRLVLRIPITLLEVNTLGHVLCALLIYAMWWHKPRWVTQPTRLEGDWTGPLGAFMFMSSKISHQDENVKGILRDFGSQAEMSHLAFNPLREDEPSSAISPDSCSTDVQQKDFAQSKAFESGHKGAFGPRPTSLAVDLSKDKPGQMEKALPPTPKTFATNATTLRRWELAAQAISQYPSISKLLEKPLDKESRMYVNALRTYPEIPSRFKKTDERRPSKPISDAWFECISEQYVVDNESNWPSDDLYKDMGGLVMGSLIWFASIGYSAVHLTAWHADFPSIVEQWMWRVASLYIGFSGILWLVIIALAQASSTIWWYWYGLLTREGARDFGYVILGCLCGVCGTLYVGSRIFIVVEAFISLRSLKVGAYLAPEWVVSVPHL